MQRSFLIVFLFFFFVLNAQDSLHVRLKTTNNYDQLMLYKIKGAHQEYIANSKSGDNTFKFEWPLNTEPGIYRLFFDIQNVGFFEVLYNNESIEVAFDPEMPDESTVFSKSKENKMYQTYIQSINKEQSKVDSLQLIYFDSLDNEAIKKNYASAVVAVNNLQHSFEEMSIDLMAHSFIKSGKKFNAEEIIETPEAYLYHIESHYFDAIDFSNEDLKNSSFFIDAAVEYIFYMNNAEDEATYQSIKRQAISKVMQKIGENYDVKREIISSLLYAFAGQEEIELVAYLKKDHYEKLPASYKDIGFIEQINSMLKVVIGSTAPEISWEQDGKTMNLSDLNTAQNYIVVFWSTSCSHCLIDIPKLYEFTEKLNDIQVVAVAIEEDQIGFDTHTKTMTNWINVLGLNKWKNEFAQSYDINSTPTFFILDQDKKIIARPEELEDVEAYFIN